ncbi:hypothetical protein EI94DRAFT_1812806 [Lactarius quietus]|nr:hypothetical protein EI94DRAFT_1812806 [Lactarius quietus]
MLRAAFLGCALILPALFASAFTEELDFGAESLVANIAQIPFGHHDYRLVCDGISRGISPASLVFYPESPQFAEDISHWVNSTSQISACSVRPDTVEDLSSIVRELGITRTPFAIKGAGHSTNSGFSSTPGVQISMARFRDIVLNEEEGTVEIGAGLTWTEVYSYLVPKGLTVVGGRIDGVGVSGYTLGGGYSWKSNQYGLTIDTVTAFELVLPNGHVKKVTEKDEDLWFALRGGLNNFGIVTKFTFKTYEQTDIWAALLAFKGDQIEPAFNAFSKWTSIDHDRKSVQIGGIIYSNGTGLPLNLFLVSAYLDGVPLLQYSVPVLKAIVDDVKTLGDKLSEKDKDTVINFELEPFESDIFMHGEPSAYPPDRSRTIHPSSVLVAWSDKSLDRDKYVYDSLRNLSASILESGIKDGQDLKDAATYTNYALYGTPLERMYGKNVKRLRGIKKKYDPFHVMDLAGGFKF